MDLVRLPSLLPLLALFSSEESRVGVVRKLLEKLTTVEEVVEDKVTIGGIIFFCFYFKDRYSVASILVSSDVLGSLAKTLAGSVSALTSPVRFKAIGTENSLYPS